MLPLYDHRTDGGFPFWVIAIIAINVYVFYLELTVPNPDAFITTYSLVPYDINLMHPASLLTFITSQFLHGGFLHIATNMWFLWIFGDNVEGRLGNVFFPILYLASGIIGNLVQYAVAISSTVPTLGASGAIAGILGAYYALFPNNKVKTMVFILFFVAPVDIPASFMLFYWFILQLFNSAAAISPVINNTGGISYFAHIGGFALGWLAGKFFFLRYRTA